MRKPRKVSCPKSPKYPKGVKYVGAIEYRGKQKHVGTFPTLKEWNEARDRIWEDFKAEVDAELAGRSGRGRRDMTVAQFANITFDDNGRAVPLDPSRKMWPWSHPKPRRTKDSSYQRAHEAIRPFVREHGERKLRDWTREQARTYAESVGANVRQAVRQFFGDALDDEVLNGRNYFAGLGIGTPKRKDDEDFEIIDDEFFELLQDKALASRADDYGLILKGFVVWMGWTCCRPVELFNLTHDDVLLDKDEINVPREFDKSSRGKRPVLPPACKEIYLQMPRISRYVFPAPRGDRFSASGFHGYWHPIRVAAGRPEFQAYELKHYAITRMIDDPPWGLGLSPLEAAFQAGHNDDGRTVLRYYAKLRERETRERIKQAMLAHHDARHGRHLRAVGE